MKVMWWLSEFPPDPGGIGRLAFQIGPMLVERGVDVHHLVAWHGPAEEQSNGVPIIRIPARDALLENRPAELLAVRRAIADTKRRVAPDLYHLHVCEPSPVLHVGTQSAHPAPSVVTLHNEVLGTIGGGGGGTLLGRVFDDASVITTVSSAAADDLVEGRPDLAMKVVVVENGMAVGSEPPPLTTEPVIAAIGRLVPQKRIDRVLRAVAQLLPLVPEVRLVVAGDGSEAAALARLADELGMGDRVEFLGHVSADEVRSVLERCRVVVAPSEWEGLPFALLEAAERERPMVATAVGGSSAVVVDGVTGLLVDNATVDGDLDILVAAVERVLTEPGLAERLGRQARERVRIRFDVARCVEAYDIVYRRVVDTSPRPRVSVIMPARNASRFIGDAIASVQAQTFTDWEIVVVDDDSSDDTAQVAARVGGDRCTVLRQPHRGSGPSRNAALAIARGELIAHLDADDMWPSDRLECLVAVLDADPSLEAVFGMGAEFADHDAPPNALVATEPQPVRLASTGIVTRAAHERVGAFRLAGMVGDQVDWIARALALDLRYSTIDHLVLQRRIHGTNTSHRNAGSTGRILAVRDALALRRQRAAAAAEQPSTDA